MMKSHSNTGRNRPFNEKKTIRKWWETRKHSPEHTWLDSHAQQQGLPQDEVEQQISINQRPWGKTTAPLRKKHELEK